MAMTVGNKQLSVAGACLALLASVAILLSASPLFAAGDEAVTADRAMTLLKEGNARFVEGKSESPNVGAARLADTAANGQHPVVTVVSCSDSRVPVERIFDRGIGDVFVIRVAGNVCNTDEIGSVEYGADHLGTPLLVVLGHTGCGAVTAAVIKATVHGCIPALINNITPAVAAAKKANPGMADKELVNEAIKANVWQSIADVYRRSAATRERIKTGKLIVVGAVYNISDGKVA